MDEVPGHAYEMKAASGLWSWLGQHLGLRNARTLKIPNRGVDEAFAGTLEQVQEDGAATERLAFRALATPTARPYTQHFQSLPPQINAT